jgi:hypothetical protein
MPYDNETTKAGAVTDPTVWSAGHTPTALETVNVKHNLFCANGNSITCAVLDFTGEGNFGKTGTSAGTLTLTATTSFSAATGTENDTFDLWANARVNIISPSISWTSAAGNVCFFYPYSGTGGIVTLTGNVTLTGTVGSEGFGLFEPDPAYTVAIIINGNVTIGAGGRLGTYTCLTGSLANSLTINGNVTGAAAWDGPEELAMLGPGTAIRITGNVDMSASTVYTTYLPSLFAFAQGGSVWIGGNVVLVNGGSPVAALCSFYGLSGRISVGGGASDPANAGLYASPGGAGGPPLVI